MLINLRNALMAGKRLPYDAEVEYLQSSGTQWIDTGILPTTTTTIKARCALLQSNNWSNLIGCGRSSGSFFFAIGRTDNTTTARTIYGTDKSGGTYSFSYSFGTVLDIVYNDSKKFYINGVLANTFTANYSPSSENIMALGINQANYNSSGRVYSLKIYSNGVNSTVLRDFIPVRFTNEQGVSEGAMFDRVSGKLFGNAGTGDFVVGPDVVPVEYIESHGTEYIDTGILAKVGLRVATKFAFSALSNYGTLFNVQYPNNNYLGVRLNGNTSNLQAIVRSGVLALGAITVGDYNTLDGIWTSTGATITLNGTTYTGTNGAVAGNTSYPIYMFAGNLQNAAAYYSSAKFVDLQMWDNGDPVRKFSPVRVGTEGAMMDVLTRRVYRNAGTGAFGYGNDLPYPIPAS